MSGLRGRVAWIFEDHFDIDLIIGVKNIGETDIDKLLKVCMKDYNPNFIHEVQPGDILVAGRNFGYGHPHPQAMRVMRHLGIKSIIAKSFFRGFFKNEISSGMVLLPCPGIPDSIQLWEELEIDLNKWCVRRLSTEETLPLATIPPVEIDIIRAGGIVPYLKARFST